MKSQSGKSKNLFVFFILKENDSNIIKWIDI